MASAVGRVDAASERKSESCRHRRRSARRSVHAGVVGRGGIAPGTPCRRPRPSAALPTRRTPADPSCPGPVVRRAAVDDADPLPAPTRWRRPVTRWRRIAGRRSGRRSAAGRRSSSPKDRSCSSARRSRKARGERTAWATSWVGGQVGEGPPHLALEPAPPPAQVVPRRADLARHLGELLGSQDDQRDDQDDQQFRRAERQHLVVESTSTPGRATARRPGSGAGPAPPRSGSGARADTASGRPLGRIRRSGAR